MSPVAPRLLAVDLDGTLISRGGQPHEADVLALRAARDAGVVVTIVTGRLYSGTHLAAEALGLEGPLGCADGSHIVHAVTGATLAHTSIRGEDAARLRSHLEAREVTTFLFAQDAIVHDEAGDDFVHYVRTWSPRLERAARVLEHRAWHHDEGVTAVVAVADEARIGETTASIRRELAHAAQVLSFPIGQTGLWGLLTRSQGIDKGTALRFIAQHAAVPLEATVAVGDWLNDVPMFRAAGRSFCMGQAPEDVKAAATDVLPETAEAGGGIARVVREVFGVR
ncbi:MAG: HAD-IIB family hydrolase [Myxococcales bacterium]|nr:HAD-IIB family hydrolase [Myxococcales bacterium]